MLLTPCCQQTQNLDAISVLSFLGKGNTNSSQKYCGKVHLLPKLPLLHVVQDGCEISLENECDMILFRSLHSDLR